MNRMLALRLMASTMLFGSMTVAHADAPSIGSPAPEFRLQDQNGKWHQLKDYRGKWVALYFYPKDQTPGCTAQACEFRDNIFAFKEANAQIVGISVDDVDSHQKFSEKHSLPFPILADSDKRVVKTYDVLSFTGFAKRETFLIDPQGVIVKRYVVSDPKGHSETVLKDLKELQKKASSP
jgi:thioredoxin-dependent peroxiredoxin